MTAVAPADARATPEAPKAPARDGRAETPAPSALERIGNAAYLVFFGGYLLFALAVLAMGIGAVVAKYNLDFHDSLHEWALTDSTWGRVSLRMADASHRAESWPSLLLDYGFSFFNIGLALVLVWLRRHERTARLLSIGMVGTAAIFNLQAQSVYEILSPTPGEQFTHDAFHLIASVSYLAAMVLFPDGHLVPRWKAWKLAVFYAAVVLLVAPIASIARGSGLTVGLIMAFGVLTPAVTPLERQQARLMFWALTPALIVGVFAVVYAARNNSGPDFEGRDLFELPVEIFRVFQPVFMVIPIALFVGILRYRLWDIDRLISRTLVYSVLAGFVSVVYVGVVVGLGALVGGANTENLGLSIVATGIVALAFQPVKERVTLFANYLVYGKRATPYEVLSEFTQRVSETPGADEVVARMARLLGEGTGARRADVWLKVGNELRPAASWPENVDVPEPLVITGPEIPWIENVTSAAAVRHQGELFGALSVSKPQNETLTPTEDKLLADLARQAGLVLRNVQLTADLLARVEELRASRQRLVAAQDETRRRLDRNLHDGAQQQLVALKVQLALIEGMVEDLGDDAKPVGEMLGMVKAQLGDALEDLRDLARGIFPPLLAAEGLPSALAGQARKATVPVEVKATDIGRYGQDAESAVYFCVLEALQNIQKYAEATEVIVSLEEVAGQLRFEVRDNGKGFDLESTPHGSGVVNMRDRVEALDGSLEIISAPGEGTTVVGCMPVTRQS